MSKLDFFTIEEHIENEIIEKKSRFITNVFHVESKSEAEEFIKLTKKKYYDAKHNCFAFNVFEENQEIIKCSDDGEPSGTAGEPILNAIKKNNLHNILIIVTRYFGGILLGAGGLTRVYSNSAVEAIKSSKIVHKELGIEAQIEINYNDNEKFKYYCEKNNIRIINTEYNETIICKIELNEEEYEKLLLQNRENIIQKTINIKTLNKICRKYV